MPEPSQLTQSECLPRKPICHLLLWIATFSWPASTHNAHRGVQTMSTINYRPEIDGLRAFAVVPVIAFHINPSKLPGGFIGVDVFFVISGYLITKIISKEMDADTFSFRAFWARRIRRILPALLLVTACTLLFSFFTIPRLEQQLVGVQGLMALASLANIYSWKSTGDYWGPTAEDSPFLHTWSLSLEEQFYIVFPALLWIFSSRKAVVIPRVIGLLVAFSFCLFSWWKTADPMAAFYLLPARSWELLVGALIAILPSKSHSAGRALNVLGSLGLCMIIVAYFCINTLDHGLALGVIGAACIISFSDSGACHRLLSNPAITHIGKLSYSLYLWHWPVLVLSRRAGYAWQGTRSWIMLVLLTYALSLLTYTFVETPFRRRESTLKPIFLAFMISLAAASGMGFIQRAYDTSTYEHPLWVEYNCSPRWAPSNSSSFFNVDISNPFYSRDVFITGTGIRVNCENSPPRVVVLGDSHATMWSDAIVSVATEMQIPVSLYVMNRNESPFFRIPIVRGHGTRNLTSEEKYAFDKMRYHALLEAKPDLVVIAARWHRDIKSSSFDLLSLLRAKAIPVLLIEDPPEIDMPSRNLLQHLAHHGQLSGSSIALPARTVQDMKRGVLQQLVERYDNVSVLSTADLFLSGEEVLVVEDYAPLYLDDDHVTVQGARRIVPRLRSAIERVLDAPPSL
ncbi:MAG TPA: hypothetical protein DDW52_10445 [Planctomycetaceae bacterium]|nr:hypothetical protein [Planctomycetaceae bacterium]